MNQFFNWTKVVPLDRLLHNNNETITYEHNKKSSQEVTISVRQSMIEVLKGKPGFQSSLLFHFDLLHCLN